MEINDNTILTNDILIELYKNNYNNQFLKNLIDNNIIDGIDYKGFKKILEFTSKKDIYEIYDNDFILMLCRNFILLYNDVDKDELYEPEELYKINLMKIKLNHFMK